MGETANIYLSSKTGRLVIQPLVAYSGSASVEFGEPTVIAGSDFEREIVPAVRKALEAYRTAKYDPQHKSVRSRAENQKFIKEHTSISISIVADGLLCLRPCHREKGGYITQKGEELFIRMSADFPEIAATIRRALDLAS